MEPMTTSRDARPRYLVQAPAEPLILLSLPRTGSTLLQRLLAAHPDIATSAEPNILLYPLLSLRSHGLRGRHPHAELHDAVGEFAANLPEGRRAYLSAVADFARRLYTSAMATGGRYFLDKSPAYCLIAPEILETFESGRFLFLWRHPLAVAASLMQFPGSDAGRWSLYKFYPYLFDGLAQLVAAYLRHQDRVLSLRYEDLVTTPQASLATVLGYLDLHAEGDLTDRFGGVVLNGRFADPNSRHRDYQVLRSDRTDAWKAVLANPLRKRWSRLYLRWIGAERLALMGYDLESLLAEVDALPMSAAQLKRDLYWMPYGDAYRLLNGRLLRDNLRARRAGEPYYAYH